ncbi:hypothetical protein WMY93_024882 [Mugilogobius chulae]|uniref:Metalloendopeptidase OMA1, mitochondrial n=1 Tax=Mugilogobius chulae TaxID=88201 RepID=A0AAW0N5A7_9GOBI
MLTSKEMYLTAALVSAGILPWELDSSISAENREVIEKMLLEEQYYLTGQEIPKNFWESESNKPKVKKSPTKVSSASSSRWSAEEKKRFEEGLAQYGRRWTKIAKLMGSRTVLQAKAKAKAAAPSTDPVLQMHPQSSSSHTFTLANAVRIEKLSDDEDEEIDITDDDCEPTEDKTSDIQVKSEATKTQIDEARHEQQDISFTTAESLDETEDKPSCSLVSSMTQQKHISLMSKSKPKYLNKTSVRPGLKNCGDVNCIGRIHTYLELIGAINFNCEQAVYNRPRIVDRTKQKEGKDVLEAYQLAQRLQNMRTRKRRVRDVWGNWRDAKDLEGQTYEHLSAEELAKRREEMKNMPKPSKMSRYKESFDPFKLIPCRSFGDDVQEPFQIIVCAETLLIMDLHAHVSRGEVIGLLGGTYNEEEKILKVCVAEPCNSVSTGLQCEMDPVSQTLACDILSSLGYSVVGWYHSHPSFHPNPSVRDIHTQDQFQSYFSRGGAPFIGMIVSPYDPANPSPHSQTTCLLVKANYDESGLQKLPYKFDFLPSQDIPDWEQTLRRAQWIIQKYSQTPGSVQMSRFFRRDSHLTCLEKMLSSLAKYLEPLPDDEGDPFLVQIEALFLSEFIPRQQTFEQEAMESLNVPPEPMDSADCDQILHPPETSQDLKEDDTIASENVVLHLGSVLPTEHDIYFVKRAGPRDSAGGLTRYRHFHSSAPRRAFPAPLVWMVLKPLQKLMAIILGRSIRKWWVALPDNRRQLLREWMWLQRWRLAAGVGVTLVITAVLLFTHLEESPMTGRTRLLVFSKENYMELAALMSEAYMEEFAELLLPDPKVNAFVLPNGKVFVFTGMLDAVADVHQLTIVLGHEMAHALLGHAAEQASLSHVVDLLSLILLTAIWAICPRDSLALLGHWVQEKLSQLMFSRPYSRKLEAEADEVGLQLAAKACADVRAGPVFWQQMEMRDRLQGELELPEWLSTHPSHKNRYTQMDRLIPQALELRASCVCPNLPKTDPRVVFSKSVRLLLEKAKNQTKVHSDEDPKPKSHSQVSTLPTAAVMALTPLTRTLTSAQENKEPVIDNATTSLMLSLDEMDQKVQSNS